jgi:hypothetical protein
VIIVIFIVIFILAEPFRAGHIAFVWARNMGIFFGVITDRFSRP